MSFEVDVRHQTPTGLRTFRVDLHDPRVHSIEFEPTMGLTLHADLCGTPPLWFWGHPWHKRRPDIEARQNDGWVHAEVAGPEGIVVRRISRAAWERARTYWVIVEAEAREAAALCGVELPAGPGKATALSLPAGMPEELATLPARFLVLAKKIKKRESRSRIVPAMLTLMAIYWPQMQPVPGSGRLAWELGIPLEGEEGVLKYCHLRKMVAPKAIQRNTCDATRLELAGESIYLDIELIGALVVIRWTPPGPSRDHLTLERHRP
jgi:hypothetical protein